MHKTMSRILLYILTIGFFLSSCHYPKMIYKPNVNSLIINDSIYAEFSNGDLLYSGNFHYFTQLYMDNKSHSTVYIDKHLYTMVSIYESISSFYKFDHLSDSIIEPYSSKKIYMAFDSRKDTIISDFTSNRRNLKKNHKFAMNLHFIVGDSIVSKEIVFKPK